MDPVGPVVDDGAAPGQGDSDEQPGKDDYGYPAAQPKQQRLAEEDRTGQAGSGAWAAGPQGQAGRLPQGRAQSPDLVRRTPLYEARNAERYARQRLIREYEELAGATLIVVIDDIFPENLTYLEELIFDSRPEQPLHMMLASPGGDGETAIRMVRLAQARCSEFTVIVPDMAKSAATLLCLGADRILMGPAGDLGPVDPQFPTGNRGLVSAKEIVEAVREAEERVTSAPDTLPLFANLLADVDMLRVEQARNALGRSDALVREALACVASRGAEEVEELTQRLHAPLIEEPNVHSAVISASAAKSFGLPVQEADTQSREWALVWSLWTRYFSMGCFPAGLVSVYEGRQASNVIRPRPPATN